MSTRALWVALSISLAVNLFGVGAFVGSKLSDSPRGILVPEKGPDPRTRNPVGAAIRELSPEAQAAWRARSIEFSTRTAPKMREARTLSQAAFRSLGDPEFSPEAARANLERARELEFEGRLEMDRRLVAFAETLSPADRSRLAEALARSRAPRGDRPPR
ncbi:MAG: periplasmic heavy metal sensor [Alphaproteobacteria bacterium]